MILHTTDGGKVWNIVEHHDIEIGQVNRMDAIGFRDVRDEERSGKNTGKIHANVWIVDEDGGDWDMIHSLYNGDLWRQKDVPHPPGGENWEDLVSVIPKMICIFANGVP
jgi:hypothetical protein